MATTPIRRVRNAATQLVYQRLVIESPLAPAEVIERLRAAADAERSWPRRSQTDKVFRGSVGDSDFRLVRAIAYFNSFLPIIEGRVESDVGGSRVAATLRLHGFVAAFGLLWFGLLTLFTVGLAEVVLSSHRSAWILLAPLAFYGFGVGLLMMGFGPEARRARALLEAIVAGRSPPAPTEDWFESSGNWGWRDVRHAGMLGYLAVLSYPVAMVLALLAWFRRPGCGNREALDPTIYCPAGWRTLSVWAIFAGVMGAAFLGSVALRRRRRSMLALALMYNATAVAVLLWILSNSAFFPHRR